LLLKLFTSNLCTFLFVGFCVGGIRNRNYWKFPNAKRDLKAATLRGESSLRLPRGPKGGVLFWYEWLNWFGPLGSFLFFSFWWVVAFNVVIVVAFLIAIVIIVVVIVFGVGVFVVGSTSKTFCCLSLRLMNIL